METKDYLQLVAIIITLLIGTANLIFYIRSSKKTRLTNIASTRRKERLDNLIECSSRFLALTNPISLNVCTIRRDADYINELLETFYILSMYLDSRYVKDVEIIRHFKLLEEEATKYFLGYNQSSAKDELDSKYIKLYSLLVDKAYTLMNLFIVTEWERLKKESEKGVTIGLERWEELYKEGVKYYQKANYPYGGSAPISSIHRNDRD
ncbi:MAG: hypothetical protein FWC96_09690 [Oscillospiraceae bacterium]|nr:hypothetical protein [Oscillospiraceae bacterium]